MNRGGLCQRAGSRPNCSAPASAWSPRRPGRAAVRRCHWSAGTRRWTAWRPRSARLQRAHGNDAAGAFGGGLTNEKAYWPCEFARVALRTPNINCNGRLCTPPAAAAATRAFGIDCGLPFPLADLAAAA